MSIIAVQAPLSFCALARRRPPSVVILRLNAFALNEKGEIVDLFHGLEDLENKVLRAVGLPHERFNEDALRIMRGFRFQASLGFELEDATFDAMKECAPLLEKISVERTFIEFDKLLLSPYWRQGLEAMLASEAFHYLPEMKDRKEALERLFDIELEFTFQLLSKLGLLWF